MNKLISFLFSFVILSVFFTFPLFSQASEQLNAVLEESNISYQLDAEGDYRIELELSENRSQIVWIRSKTNTYRDQEIREILSIAAEYPSNIPVTIMKKLLGDNYSTTIMGGWGTVYQKTEDIFSIIYLVKIPAEASRDLLFSALYETAETADSVEYLLKGGTDWF